MPVNGLDGGEGAANEESGVMAKKLLPEWTDAELQNLADNYERRGVVVGGPYPLSDILLEQRHRLAPPEAPVARVFDIILDQSRRSADGLTTYGELYAELFPGKEWLGNAPRALISKILDGVIGYCVDKGMPLVSVLVVRQSNRCLDPSAKKEIVRVAKSLGVDVGDSETFLDRQIEAAKELARRGVS